MWGCGDFALSEKKWEELIKKCKRINCTSSAIIKSVRKRAECTVVAFDTGLFKHRNDSLQGAACVMYTQWIVYECFEDLHCVKWRTRLLGSVRAAADTG